MTTNPAPPTAGTLIDVLLRIHRQEQLADVLLATATGSARMAAGAYVGSLLRDTGTDAWYLTTLVSADGRAVPLDRLGVSVGPFPLTPPPGSGAIALAQILGGAWGEEGCGAVEEKLLTRAAVCVPVTDSQGVRAALLALIANPAHGPIVAGLLAHAAVAAARLVGTEAPATGPRVLGPAQLADAAESEIARALRYQRDLTVVVFEANSVEEMARFGPALQRTLRRWDVVGRVGVDRPVLAALLPEADRPDARGLINRLSSMLTGIASGIAVYRDDGATFERLTEVARLRASRSLSNVDERESPDGPTDVWYRGVQMRTDTDTVRCPRCSTPFSRRRPPRHTEEVRAATIEAVRARLIDECPHHQPQMTVSP
jgi:hypothetical protein